MKNLVALLFMCVMSLAVLTSTAQDEKKGSKGKAKTDKKETTPKKEKVEKTAKTEKKEKAEKPEKKEKVEKTVKTEKKEKPEKKEKIEKTAKVEKKEKTEKVEKTAKIDKKEKVEKPEKTTKVEKTEKITKVDKKAADKDNTIKPAPKPVKNDDGKEADVSTRKKVAGADKQVGRDEKGRTVFEGSRGGQYYINSNGNKTYLKADRKI